MGMHRQERKADDAVAPVHAREPFVGLRPRPAEHRHAVDLKRLQPVAIRVEERLESLLGRRQPFEGLGRFRHQYAASLRIPSAIFSGLTMNHSSRTWLYGTPGTSGPAIRVTGPSR